MCMLVEQFWLIITILFFNKISFLCYNLYTQALTFKYVKGITTHNRVTKGLGILCVASEVAQFNQSLLQPPTAGL